MITLACWVVLLAPPAPAAFRVTTVDGTAAAAVTALDEQLRVAVADAAPAELVTLRRIGRPLPPRPRGPVLVLANGDVVAGTALGGTANALSFRPDFAGPAAAPWAVPLAAVAAVWVETPALEPPPEPARYGWVVGKKQDAALLRNGDVLAGALDGFTPGGVRFKPAGGASEVVPLARVAALALDPSLARPRRIPAIHARVTLADGSRLTLTKVSGTAARLTGTPAAGPPVELPWDDVAYLEVLRGKSTPLSALKPKAETVTPYTALAWPWQVDRSAHGRPLRLRGEWGTDAHDRGLGLHPTTRLTYDLAGKYRRFDAEIGLDAVSGRHGNAVVTILLDGKPADVPALNHLTASSGTVSVSLAIVGVKELTLVVESGPNGDVQDDVNVAAARLVE